MYKYEEETRAALARTAEDVLFSPAVNFERQGLRPVSKNGYYPYFAPFIPYPYPEFDRLCGGLGIPGYLVRTGTRLSISVFTGDDAPFRHLCTKFKVFRAYGQTSNLAGTVSVTANSTTVTGVGTAFLTDFEPGQVIGITGSTSKFIDTITSNTVLNVAYAYTANNAGATYGLGDAGFSSVSAMKQMMRRVEVRLDQVSSGGRNIFGGNEFLDSRFQEQLLGIDTMQTYADGFGMIRTPYIIDNKGIIQITVVNNNTFDIYLNGTCMGYKITI